jgi:hypothetical protein
MEAVAQLLQNILQKTGSEIVVFVVVVIPLYMLIIKDRKANRIADAKRIEEENKAQNARQDKYIEREYRILQVIKENSEAIASLKATLDRDGQSHVASLDRIHKRIDDIFNDLAAQDGAIVKMQSSFDDTLRNHLEIKDDMKKILLILTREEHEPQNGG